MIGSKLARYELTGKLGSRRGGVVYRAWDPEWARELALKILPAGVADSPEHLARFERDCQLVNALQHPHLVEIFTVERAEGIVFVTMARVDGRALSEEIGPEGMASSRVLEIAIPLTDAIAAMHGQGVLHGALEPDHILIDRDGSPRIINFGLRRLAPPGGLVAPARGPERAPGHDQTTLPPTVAAGSEWDVRSDLFCFGAILHEMAIGRKPGAAFDSISSLAAESRGSSAVGMGIPAAHPLELYRIVARCLAADPARCFPTARALHQALQALHADLLAVRRGEPAAPGGEPPASQGRWVERSGVGGGDRSADGDAGEASSRPASDGHET